MSNKSKYIEDLESIRDQLRQEREEHFKNMSDPRKGKDKEWTEVEKSNQRYHDAVEQSYAEYYKRYGDPDNEQR
ncbi:hypothetical protein PBI_SCTP2_357 [Salicola phage SCTP-2]|nr:hypothetical protein PBI_SCTP2_357 [Salicola phage SCTP-2]